MTETAHTPLPYECFQDRSYYDMWCVRRVNEREWGKGFHLVNGEEAAALRDMLNTRADSHHRLVETLEWYEEQARLCRLIHSEGDAGRQALSADGGKRARAALKEAGR